MLRGVDYHGLRKASRFVARFFQDKNSVIISQGERKFKIYLNDPYWIKYVYAGFTYEDEVKSVLDAVLDSGSVFIDCGANTGYWSIYAATKIRSPTRIVAIEPAREIFRRLSENMELNNKSFTVVRKAVFSSSGADLQFRAHPIQHDSSSCVFESTGEEQGFRIETVKPTTIDAVFDQLQLPPDKISNVVVKLDVEGAEREALQGTRKLIGNGALLVYEDHGIDMSCATTGSVLNEWDLEVYFLRRRLAPLRIEDLKQLADLKKSATVGYNLIAAQRNSPALERALAGLTKRTPESALTGC